jgi:hypothetical protein
LFWLTVLVQDHGAESDDGFGGRVPRWFRKGIFRQSREERKEEEKR